MWCLWFGVLCLNTWCVLCLACFVLLSFRFVSCDGSFAIVLCLVCVVVMVLCFVVFRFGSVLCCLVKFPGFALRGVLCGCAC